MLLAASKIHDGNKWLPEGTVIETNENGLITALHPASAQKEATYYEGILAPGFVNAHCHLELSHMKGMIPEHTGLVPFLQQVMQYRNAFTDEQKAAAREEAFNAMLERGIVALGDIANVTDTADQRASGKMHFHTFVESIGFSEAPQKQFEYAVSVFKTFAAQPSNGRILYQSIVPHAPYSVSHTLFSLIDKFDKQSLISIHNQECRDEDQYYLLKEGGIQTLLHSLGINDDFFKPSGKTSLQTYLEWLSSEHPFIFVHNTYTSRNDIEVAHTLLHEVHWCLCPSANLYIENALPPVELLMEDNANICIGTDSLSSNHRLCILSELVTLKKHFPHLNWETLLQWGTANGARALQMQHVVGTIATGTQPGILHLQNLDSNPTVTRII